MAEGEETAYIVLWFAPDGDCEKSFGNDEDKARRYAARPEIAEWHPILLRRHTVVAEEMLALGSPC